MSEAGENVVAMLEDPEQAQAGEARQCTACQIANWLAARLGQINREPRVRPPPAQRVNLAAETMRKTEIFRGVTREDMPRSKRARRDEEIMRSGIEMVLGRRQLLTRRSSLPPCEPRRSVWYVCVMRCRRDGYAAKVVSARKRRQVAGEARQAMLRRGYARLAAARRQHRRHRDLPTRSASRE